MILTSKNRRIALDSPRTMGIINATPDSFSDGGKYNKLDAALYHAESMVTAGVSFFDIGGESTRPGAKDVSEQEELSRVIPLIEALRERFDTWISIDTSKAVVMREAVHAGADLINDIRALQEPNALQTAAELQVPVCLMHMQGQPRTMQANPTYKDLISDVGDFLQQRIQTCEEVGLSRKQLLLDPGFGFGKTVQHNYQLLAHLEEFHRFKLPLLVGMSRKSMICKLLDIKPTQTLAGSLACASIAAMKGAQIVRVHDVAETVQAMAVCQATLEQN